MNYTKPQVAILGDAKSIIAVITYKPWLVVTDGFELLRFTVPAYDLDE
jgi:hypothetical protein